MAATTFAAFDPKPLRLGTVINFTATSAIKQGHLVGFAATGVANEVIPVTGGTSAAGIKPIGIALYAAAAGQKVAVACVGSVVKALAATDATIDAGDHLIAGATAGMVLVAPGTDSVEIGIALGDLVADTPNYILITGPTYVPTGA